MKKINLNSIIFLLMISNSVAQTNLVPNGDFEFYTSCPTAPNQTNLAFPWVDPNGATSDYYNACATLSSLVTIPSNSNGLFQYAHSGVGYTGFFGSQSFNYREYIQVKLIDSLKSNHCYVVEFYTNLVNHAGIAINNIGAYISTTAITCPPPGPYGLNAQILLPGNPVISDTLNWVKVQGTYQANGGEQYITIGNFQNDTNTIYQTVDITGMYPPYYYIDDVSVMECDTTTQRTIAIEIPNVFTPNTDGKNDEWEVKNIPNGTEIQIYNRWGANMVSTENSEGVFKWDGRSASGLQCTDGIYYYIIITTKETYKGFLQLIK